jgi:hypothetical protein
VLTFNLSRRSILLAVFISLFISPLTFASDKAIVTVQGIVMELDWNKKTIVVNERSIVLDQNTIVHNDKGSPIPRENLRAKAWVYIEGAKDRTQKRIVAQKIYLLPKYIDDKEKRRYPFIK